MANFTSKILGSAISSLNAQQAVIANTANNIANVNTPGYARRTLELQARGSSASGAGVNLGNGVDIGALARQTNGFLDRLARIAGGEAQRYAVEDEFLSRAESLFALDGSTNTISSAYNQFFDALDDLSLNPASIELRANMMERAQDLVTSISNTYNDLASLQAEADQRIAVELNTINSITTQLADLNGQIKTREATGNVAAGERDQRDQLLSKLAEKMSFDITEVSDGTINISLSNGFVLVSGVLSRNLEVTKSPSFAAGAMPPSLEGGTLNHIVYDYSNGAGTNQVELTDIIGQGEGSLGGLLRTRGVIDVTNAANTSAFQAEGTLVDMAARVESMARFLLDDFNTEYLGPDRDGGTAGHQPSSADLDGNVPSAFGLFTFAFSGARDTDADGLPDDIGTHGLDNYASLLQLAITGPRQIAAGRDASTGPPAAISVPEGDAANLEALAQMQSSNFTFSAGSYSLNGTFTNVYDETVSTLGNLRNSSRVNSSVADANLVQAQAQREEISGVSLDEEFTDLIKFQRAFEASARMIKIADELLQQVVGLI